MADEIIWQPPNEVIVHVEIEAGNVREILFSNVRSLLPGNQRTPEFIAPLGTKLIQSEIDRVIPLSSLPDEDPDKTVDPNLWNWFHGRVVETVGTGQNTYDIYGPVATEGGTATHMVSRPLRVLVTYVGPTDRDYQLYISRSSTPPGPR